MRKPCPARELVTVAKTRWRVWKNVGVTNLVEKEGSKGHKLYVLEATNLDPCCIDVREVWPGSGEVKVDKPAVTKGGDGEECCKPSIAGRSTR